MPEFERGFGSATRLTSFDEVDEVFRSQDFVQGSHIDGHPSAVLFHGSIATVDGEEHFQRRRMEAKLFRKQSLARFERSLPRALAMQFQSLAAKCDARRPVRADLVKLLRSTLMPLAAEIVGIDGLDNEHSIERLRLELLRISDGSSARWSALPLDRVVEAATAGKEAFVRDYFLPSWDRRKSMLACGEEPPDDLITLLIANPIAGWDEDVNVREALLFFTGAANTPALVTPHIVRDILEWLRHHPRDGVKCVGEGASDFLWRCAVESLRLHLEVPAHFRRAVRGGVLSSGRGYRAGEVIALDIVASSRDPGVYGAGADEFNPYREPPKRGMAFGFAFGGGRHTCIGRELMIGPQVVEASDPTATRGILTQLLGALFDHGIGLDPDRPPALSPDRNRPEYTEFGVTFAAV